MYEAPKCTAFGMRLSRVSITRHAHWLNQCNNAMHAYYCALHRAPEPALWTGDVMMPTGGASSVSGSQSVTARTGVQ
jgi:hypothetical protein